MSSKRRVSNSVPHGSRAKRRKPSDLSADELDAEPVSPGPPHSVKTRKANISRHVRFSSGSPAPAPASIDLAPPDNGHAEDQDELDDSNGDFDGLHEPSDDSDAPESILAATAEQHAKSSRASASKAVAEQRAQQKTHRRQRDAQLKAQAKSAAMSAAAVRKGPTPSMGATADGIQDESDAEEEASDQSDGTEDASPPSPELLPTHVLADEDALVIRATPTPSPPPHKKLQQPNAQAKHILLNGDSSPQPRDRRAGPVSVRVLQKSSEWLPPKAEGKAKALRESWLRGRKGKGKGRSGSMGVERKAINQGFLRR